MYVFTMPAIKWDERDPDKTAIRTMIEKHASEIGHLDKLYNYYHGKHAILDEKDRENKLVCNHAKDIADTATSYFLGNPISYKAEERDLQVLIEALEAAEADETDGDNALDLAIFGRAYDYIYTRKDDTELMIKNLDPRNTFMVYDDSIEQNELFAVYYYVKKDDSIHSAASEYIATVLTEHYLWVFDLPKIPSEASVLQGPEEHFKSRIPITEWLNNKMGLGDYELQIPLIDAYNALMSDRITDKEQFIDSILAIYGTLLSDDEGTESDTDPSDTPMKRLKREKLLEMPDGSRAEYLIRTFDEAGVDVLRRAIEQDIHKFSHIPCLTDENFAGNVSGVAMEFKLLGIENITKIKTRYYRKGLRKRLQIFCDWIQTNGRGTIDPNKIKAVFTRAMPKNLLEISQYVANLKGTVSQRTLLAQIPFVDDPDAEIKAVEKENEEAAHRQRELFMENGQENTPPDEGDDEKKEDPEDGDVNA